MRILLIEDETPAALQLTRSIVKIMPNATIIATIDSVANSVQWLKSNPAPDLIFMDIQIADGLSFDIFKYVQVQAPIIFTTAFDQYAIQAFKVNAIDYLLKPIDPEELEQSLLRFQQRGLQPSNSIQLSEIEKLFKKPAHKDRFLVKVGANLAFLQTTDIAYFRSSEGLTQAYTLSGKKYFIDHTLEDLEQLLDPQDFFRISRQITVRLKAITKIAPHLNGRLKLDLSPTPDDEVYVSRERASEFKVWLGG